MRKFLAGILLLITFSPYAGLAATQSATLNGSTQWFSLIGTTAAVRITGAMTFCAKWKSTAIGTSNNYKLVGKGHTLVTTEFDYDVVVRTDGSGNQFYDFNRGRGVATDSATVAASFAANTWYYTCVTYDGSTSVAFYQGTTLASIAQVSTTQTITTGTTNDSTTFDFTIGCVYGNAACGGFFPGQMADVWMFDDDITLATAQTYFCTPPTSGSANIRGIWSLDNVVTDASGNGNTLTNNGTTPFAADVMDLAGCGVVQTPITGLVQAFWIF